MGSVSSTGYSITKSPFRPFIDDLLKKNLTPKQIALKLYDEHDDGFPSSTIAAYKKNYFERTLYAMHDVTADMVNNEPPATSDGEALATYFSFGSTNRDMELIYERVRALRMEAEKSPSTASYDARIVKFLDQAEKIRQRVFRFQYEQVRRAILSTTGKKLCLAAVSAFMPHVPEQHKAEALKKFESMVTPLLESKASPDIPEDMKRETDGKT